MRPPPGALPCGVAAVPHPRRRGAAARVRRGAPSRARARAGARARRGRGGDHARVRGARARPPYVLAGARGCHAGDRDGDRARPDGVAPGVADGGVRRGDHVRPARPAGVRGRQVLPALAARGVRSTQAPLADAPAHGDLAAARRAPFTPAGASSDEAPAPVPGDVTLGRLSGVFAPARLSPSAADAIACSVGDVVELGPRLALTGRPDMEHVGLDVDPLPGARARGRDPAPVVLIVRQPTLQSVVRCLGAPGSGHGTGRCAMIIRPQRRIVRNRQGGRSIRGWGDDRYARRATRGHPEAG